ncbi:GGDEF domain-containing protein [uncultured Enterovirga sp.]|uniref:GGDEF domain-containing protein n=1 Tax=uncultured Enterovirga sp. TaxID=2026352 RepID=UPI0035C9B857
MGLDLATLSISTVFVTALVGILLIFSWWQNRSVGALAWWGSGLVLASLSCVFLAGRAIFPGWLSIGFGNALLFSAFGLFWAGCRVFERRPMSWMVVFAGALLWLAACGVPDFYRSFSYRVGLSSVITSSYALLGAWDIWRGRSERLVSRYPLVVILVAHSAMVLSRYPTLGHWGFPDERMVFTKTWVVAHAFEGLMFAVTSAFLLLAMTKERVEWEQRTIASRDPLTGMRNRRAFLAEGRDLLDRARRAGTTSALLLLDLDHFKHVNDRFGHGVGDHVLRGFCGAALRSLPADALFARIGGEEFGCLLPGHDEAGASRVAEEVRAAFASCRFEANGLGFGATVSIGIATSDDVGHIMDALLAAADVSLYSAKDNGRNRVATLGDPALPSEYRPVGPFPIAA